MQFKHAPAAVSAVFDDPNIVSTAGLVPVMRLAERAGLSVLARERVTVPGVEGANAGAKVASLVAGMVAGADSIDDMNLLRHGGMTRLFDRVYAPSTLGSFLRAFTFGHVRQLDAVASRLLRGLAAHAPLLDAADERVFVDIDDSVIEVHGYQKQGAGFGYSGVRGLNALIGTAQTPNGAPVIVAQRLRRGKVNSAKGAARLVADALTTTRRITGTGTRMLLRADSAFYGHATIGTAIKAGADVSVTIRMIPNVRATIASIPENTWETIRYPKAIWDEDTSRWISDAEVAEIPFTAFTGRRKAEHIPGRLIVRRVKAHQDRHDTPALFDTHRYHAFFTTTPATDLDTVSADRAHRAHASIEQVHADLKNGPLAHLPSGVFTANAAWLVLAVIAFNLTRAAAVTADPEGPLRTATTGTIRRTLIHVAARIATTARRVTLHLPARWPWATPWATLLGAATGPPRTATN